ncbi:hypothetical protein P3X46_026233 [Hevea brasiliensis]|uniref:phenylalanine--tRNA ligase n=1 Tax=Hevea brasiliensis TaxID=3981 RepID=A0ABQ9KWA7_HEVBR|nr:hypothetical protein P3X46_026233 [Hevea brasiliensis]
MAEEAILGYLENHEEISDSGEFAAERGIDHAEIDIRTETRVLTDEGKKYAAVGSPEVQLFLALPTEGSISKEELQKKLDPGVFKIGCSQAGKNKWVEMGKQISRKVQHVEDRVKDLLLRIQDGKAVDKDDVNNLKARKLIVLQTWKGYSVRKGPNYAPKRKKPETDLTRENLQSFEEMPTNRYVESRYGYEWKRDEANKNLLRTHTTAISSRMLYALAQHAKEQPLTPKRYFSIDRVFRNEAVDRTHLAEFHQIEGLVCDRGFTLSHLIGILEDFFSRLGMSKLRFKPAYNPYTEPSMEIFSYHKGFGKWVEIGNSGMFRPEMLRPMGFPEDVSVVAWGLSLERPTMILYGIDNIRNLFGHTVDLSLMKKNPLCLIGIR